MFESEVNRYWKTVVDTIHDGIMIVDPTGMVVSVNKAFEIITGFTKAEVVGGPCTKLNCDICEIAMNQRNGHWCELFDVGRLDMRRCTIREKDGSRVHVLKNATLLRNDDGEVIGAVETLTDITEIVALDTQLKALRSELGSDVGFCGILGSSHKMRQLFDLIGNAAKSDAPVIITGESGTGKELVARALHELRGGKSRPFVKVNCAALNESLLESELFGHVKGAFTGAHLSRKGRFEAAHMGDIFLDEIGDIPLATQIKLLRVIEEKVVERVGDNRPVPIDVRIITATNQDLDDLVRRDLFREDLYYRINIIPIHVPPLRERVSDIPCLVNFFLQRRNLEYKTDPKHVSPSALEVMMSYSWPGNVRELRGALEYAQVTSNGSVIRPNHLPPRISGTLKLDESVSVTRSKKDRDNKADLLRALREAGGKQSEAARILGVSRVTIWNRMRKYGVRLQPHIKHDE